MTHPLTLLFLAFAIGFVIFATVLITDIVRKHRERED